MADNKKENSSSLPLTEETVKPEEMKQALKAANGDKELALKYIKNQDNHVIALKAHFMDTATNILGSFIFYLCLKTKKIHRVNCIASFKKDIQKITPAIAWREFERQIVENIWEGKHLAAQTREIQKGLYENILYQDMDRYCEAFEKSRHSVITTMLTELMQRVLTLASVRLTCDWETTNPYQIEAAGKDIKSADADELTEIELDKSNPESHVKQEEIVLDGTLVVSPVSGRPLSLIKEGDIVMGRINESSPRGKYFIRLYDAQEGKKIKPLPLRTRFVSRDEISGLYTLIGELGPDVVMKVVEEQDIRVMTAAALEDVKKNKSFWTWAIIIGAVLFLLALLAGWYLLFGPGSSIIG